MRARQWVVGWTAFAVAAVGGGALPGAHAAEGNTLSGTVWWDLDHDGCICAGEPGLGGVELAVTEAGDDGDLGTGDDVTHPPLTTDVTGAWALGGLAPGLYRVEVTDGVPAGLSQTYDPDDGTTDAPTTPYVVDVVMPDEASPLTIDEQDFGFASADVGDGALGDTVWLDRDGDGVQDPGSFPDVPFPELGVACVDLHVTRHGPNGVPGGDDVVVTVTTDFDGFYLLTGLPYGTYAVAVEPATLPPGLEPAFDLDGTADHTTLVSLTEDEPDRDDVDFGYRGTSSMGGRVVWDVDADGGITAADRGLGGVPVIAIWDPDEDPQTVGVMPLFTLTGPDGVYVFEDLPAGHFIVGPFGPPPGFGPTFDEDGGPEGSDGIAEVDLAVDTAHLTADFGYTGEGTIGDTVYFDDDGDGVQDPGEPGVAGQRVDLVWVGCDCEEDTEDDIVISTTTDASGNYLFANLPDGLYRVVIVGGVSDTAANTGDPDAGDPDGAPDEAYTELYVDEVEHIHDLDQDFGYQRFGSIGGTVWLDVNRDGAQQPAEPGLAGITVTLQNSGPGDGFTATSAAAGPATTTDASGAYRFDQLPAGAYEVVVTPPASSAPSSDPDGGADHLSVVSLAAGQMNLAQSFGYRGTASLTGTVFDDTDRDGAVDSGEPGVPGVTVVVRWNGPNGQVVLSTTTDAGGAWSLDGLPPGDYTVRLDPATLPAGFTATTPSDVAIALAPGGAGSAVHGLAVQASPPVPPTTDGPPTPVPGTLPATGGDRGATATIALLLLAFGLTATGVSRLRRRTAR